MVFQTVYLVFLLEFVVIAVTLPPFTSRMANASIVNKIVPSVHLLKYAQLALTQVSFPLKLDSAFFVLSAVVKFVLKTTHVLNVLLTTSSTTINVSYVT